jgi:hypothetical protein
MISSVIAVQRKTGLLLTKYHARYNNNSSEIENNTMQNTIIEKLANNSGSTLQQKINVSISTDGYIILQI